MPNPGPNTGGLPNSEPASIVVGSNVTYTFANLPAASNFLPGFTAITVDEGLCVVNASNVWEIVGSGASVAIEAGTNSLSSGTVSFANSNGVTFGMNSAGVITATVTPGAAAGIAAVQVPNTTYTSGTINFLNSNGISFGSTTGGGITASYNSTQFAGTGTTFAGTNISGSITHNSLGINLALSGPAESGIGLSAAGSSQTAGNLVLSNSNGLSFGMNGSTITGSYNSTQFAGIGTTFAAANISGSMTLNSAGLNLSLSSPTESGIGLSASGSSQTAGNIVFSNSNGVSFGMNGSTVTASVAAAGGGIDVTLGGNTSGALALVSTGTLFLAGGNNVTLSQNGNSVTISANTAAAANLSVSAGSTSGAFGGITFSNSNNQSFGLNNGTITGNVNAPGLGTTFNGANLSGSMTLNSAGLNLSLSSPVESGIGLSAAGSSQTAGNLVLSNSNGLSFGMNGSTVTASYNSTQFAGTGTTFSGTNLSGSMTLNSGGLNLALSAAVGSSQTEAIYIAGNSTGQSSQSTYTVGSFNISAAGVVSAGWSSNSLIISSPATTALTLLSAGMSTGGNTLGTTGLASNQLVLAGGNNVTLSGSTNAGSMTISIAGGGGGIGFGVSTGGNTAGSTGTVTTGNVVLVGSGPISLSQSTAGAGSAATITINAPATSSLSATGMASISVNGSTISVGAAIPQLSFFQPLGAVQSTTLTQNGAGSIQVYPAIAAFPFTATRADIMASVSLSALALSTEAQTLSMYVGLYSLNGSTLSLASSGSQSYAWSNLSNNSSASLSGMRRFSAPINVNYTGGFDLFVGVMSNTTFANTNGISLSNMVVPLGPGPQLQGLIGQTQVNSMQFVPGQGFYSASSAALPSSMGLSQISGAGSGGNAVDYYAPVQFVNMTA